MKKLFYWIFFFSILSCSKKDPCEGVEKIQITGYKNLDESQKQLMPYQGNETLLFISNKGDTALLKGTGNRQEYRRLKLSGSGFYCGEEQFDSYQFIAAEYKGNNPKFDLLRIELFKNTESEAALNFYCTNCFSFDTWRGSAIADLNVTQFFPYKFFYKGDSVITRKLKFYDLKNANNYHYMFYLPFTGIIGFQLDSLTTYTLN